MKIYGLIASIIIVVIILLISVPQLKPKYSSSTVSIETKNKTITFDVEIADTEIKRTVGLMNRTSLKETSGMLFVFGSEKTVSFWMRNTLIPLDMIFIAENGNIVNIKRNAQPCKAVDCESYKSEKPVKYVLEINVGLADKLDIKEGGTVGIKL